MTDQIIAIAKLLLGRREEYKRAAALLERLPGDEFAQVLAAYREMDAQDGTRASLLLGEEYGRAGRGAEQAVLSGGSAIRMVYRNWSEAMAERNRLTHPDSPLAAVLAATWPPKRGNFNFLECMGETFMDMTTCQAFFDKKRLEAMGDIQRVILLSGQAMAQALPARRALWQCALSESVDGEGLRMAREICDYYYYIPNEGQNRHGAGQSYPGLDSLLAQAKVYSRVSPGMLEDLRVQVQSLAEQLCARRDGAFCRVLASGFAWVGTTAESLETTILQSMLHAGLSEMDGALQERLNFLVQRDSSAPALKQADANDVAVDFGALSWNEGQFGGFFRHLAQTNQPLTYMLAISEWKKSFQPEQDWDFDAFAIMLCANCERDYEGAVTAKPLDFSALLDGGKPLPQKGVLLCPQGNQPGVNHIAVLLQASKLRRNVSLRVYTLYAPPQTQPLPVLQSMAAIALSLKQHTNPEAADLIADIINFAAETAEIFAFGQKESGLY